ncbi:hypothetical protein BDW74DRAFT_151481 [Aspergillus multicolor]|uniref:NAD(P)/FAD-dependent oxidoreductase n=1 Tax=Aspergillus multicolor TaxID=41759 RepID=UPI003CCD58AA
MSIPSNCTVLIIGGGPGGSYTASVLAREGIDSVLLEAERFPRYHIGESMLPSLRYFLRFIGLDGEFDGRGFTEKVGAAFKVAPEIPEGFFDFLAVGPNNYSWNLLRSEADSMLFAHASKSGAKAIDGVRVIDIQFDPAPGSGDIGRPVSAFYKCKGDDGSINTGTIRFDYLVDATGRAGLLSTKYLKSRVYSKALKNIAHWAYYTGAGMYAPGTKRENSPFFEGFGDGSGWAWFIPLHDGTASVGIVRNQEIFFQERKAPRVENGTDLATYYEKALSTAPVITGLLHQTASGSPAQRVSQIHSASDYSYSSTSYSLPYARIVGDAGCFIDPLFSSGFHLALVGGLAAATTIAASIRGNVSEDVAAQWHSRKITASYTRFLLVVLAVYKQIRNQREVVLRAEVNISRPPASSSPADGDLDRALEVLRPGMLPHFLLCFEIYASSQNMVPYG